MMKNKDATSSRIGDVVPISDTIVKPRTFSDLNLLKSSIKNLYINNLQRREEELAVIAEIHNHFELTGDLPAEYNLERLFMLYVDLLHCYCDDVQDLLERV